MYNIQRSESLGIFLTSVAPRSHWKSTLLEGVGIGDRYSQSDRSCLSSKVLWQGFAEGLSTMTLATS